MCAADTAKLREQLATAEATAAEHVEDVRVEAEQRACAFDPEREREAGWTRDEHEARVRWVASIGVSDLRAAELAKLSPRDRERALALRSQREKAAHEAAECERQHHREQAAASWRGRLADGEVPAIRVNG